MDIKPSLVITSIARSDHPILNDFAKTCKQRRIPFYLIGDKSSPIDFYLDGCNFYSTERQRTSGFLLSEGLPYCHYARKNLGYLEAIRNGAKIIIETDDDNYARPEFWLERSPVANAHYLQNVGWVNIYAYFTKTRIWPRGFALEHLLDVIRPLSDFMEKKVYCPIQQGLADENPDVDAIYRLTHSLPVVFEKKANIALGRNSWCPFNSQNTTWFHDAFLLMYLPSYCSFRMTDILRSFIALRIVWELDWAVLFHHPTVYQKRNTHDLMHDFADEISGYLNNNKIAAVLAALQLRKGKEFIGFNLHRCYEALIELNVVDKKELPLVNAWINDLKAMNV